MRRFAVFVVLSAVVTSAQSSFDSTVRPFVTRNCIMCHNARLRSGELDLQHHSSSANALKDRHVWEMVIQKLRTGEMPPKPLRRPKPADVASVTSLIEREFERIDKSRPPDPGRVTARRLNRTEYNNTIRDLLGIDLRPADDFPADDSGYGFDNIADVLSLSPVLMERYMAAAEKIAAASIVAKPPEFLPARLLLKPVRSAPLGEKAAGPRASRESVHVRHRFRAEGDYDLRLPVTGTDGPAPANASLTIWLDGVAVGKAEGDPRKTRGLEARVHVPAGEHYIGATMIDKNSAIEGIELRGPYNPVVPPLPASHARIIFCGHPANQHPDGCARKLVSTLARRAFRRTPTDREISRLEKLVASAREDGETFEGAMSVALQAVLVSPHFLFRIEQDPEDGRPRAITEFELASRLAYFIWSSMPDDRLLDLAERGQLRTNLTAELRRMLTDRKAEALATNFAGQWLQLRNLDEAKPDPDRFRLFDEDLRAAMKRETELFFSTVIAEDRSILDFIDGNYTFLNERLASHYGIEGIEGPEFRRVNLTTAQRSGVLTQASVLTVSSYPTRTSPVIRGKWVLENFLNAPPPPPPPDVPPLEEASIGISGSVRQQLEKHRTNPVCASCHSRMDPLGFGLENYDAIGRWRTLDGKFQVDSSGTLPNGRSFRTPAELKTILRESKDEFAKCLAEKLLTFAVGRGLEPFDKPAVQSITRRTAAGGYRFSALMLAIVDSLPFQMRRMETSNRSALRREVTNR